MKRLIEDIGLLSIRVLIFVILGFISSLCYAQPAAPELSIEIVIIEAVDHLRLSWTPVEGATSYNIYASSNADSLDWGDPIATVGDTVFVYNVPFDNDRVKLFYVTAVGDFSYPGMVYVAGGMFSPTEDYIVTISSFYIGKYEVTQSEWTSVMGEVYNPFWSHGQGDNYPAYSVSWFDAINYCNRLSIREGLTPVYGYGDSGTNPDDWPEFWNTAWQNHTNIIYNGNANGYRLPTEMEWEFAARGGVPALIRGTFDDNWAGTDVEEQLVNYAWYNANAEGNTHEVGSKLPNELGLYDMSGNVWEHTWDRYGAYPEGAYNNPTGSTTGDHRVKRGGSWSNSTIVSTVSNRTFAYGSLRSSYNGFRVCRY